MTFQSDQKYIAEMLSHKGAKFIIPPYQRPYKWGIDECETLWNDILNAFRENEGGKNEYFLGSIIAFSNPNFKNKFQIIDGQQRITTFTLLFRAFYECFETEKKKEDYPREFGSCVWEYVNNKGLEFTERHLQSEVATDREKENLSQILSEKIDEKFLEEDNKKIKNNRSPYVQNYLYFLEKLHSFKHDQSNSWGEFCDFVLEQNLFVLFVVCDSQESAMTIFNTLNSRGMPLSNADVLKGYLYKHYKEQGNIDGFIDQWSEIETNIESVESNKDVGLDFLFLQYMHIIRAINKDFNTTTIKFLDFFTSKDESKKIGNKKIQIWGSSQKWLYKDETMPFIALLADFWLRPQYYLCGKSLYYMNVLSIFQNKGWKSFVSCLVWKYKELLFQKNIDKNAISQSFEAALLELLQKISLLFLRLEATSNKIDQLVFKLNANLLNNEAITKEIDEIPYPSFETFIENMWENRANKAKYILYLYAYVYDDFSQPIDVADLQVEHILPKRWQNANFNGWDEESHKEYLEQIGNKILLPSASNLACLENFFAQKKKEYADSANSHLKEVQDLAKLSQNDWRKEDIDKRNKDIYTRLKSFFIGNM